MWEKRQANAGKIPRAKEIGIIARSAFILRSLIFFTNAWVFLNGMYAGRLVESRSNGFCGDFQRELVVAFEVKDGEDR